ncbi:MAG: cupredoxin domain-containing protein [Vicinamibacterales bacterium]
MRLFLFLIVSAAAAACSGGASSPPAAPSPLPPVGTPSPAPAPTSPPTITITATGMNPLEITINVGQRVTFVNNDTRPHDVIGGVDPNNPDCPEILQAGFLAPGQRGETGVFTRARTCEYHDHAMLTPAFQGRIIIR